MTTDWVDSVLGHHLPRVTAWEVTGEFAEVYADLVAWFRPLSHHVATDATDRIWGGVASYHDAELQADVTEHVERLYVVFWSTVEAARDPLPEDFLWSSEYAYRRVIHGIPLADFLKAFRIAQLTLWEHVLDWTRDRPGSEQASLHLVSHLMRVVEIASSVAARTYLEAQQYDLADLENIQRALVEDLLAGRRPVRARHMALLREAGLGEDQPCAVATATLVEPVGEASQETLVRCARRHLSTMGGGLWTMLGSELVALLPLAGTDEGTLRSRLQRLVDDLDGRGIALRVGIGGSRTDLAGVAESHAEALLARTSLDHGGVATLADLSTLDYLLQRPDETALSLVRPQVRAFFAEDRAADGTYGETLRAYTKHDLNAREAAKALHIHTNTMYYRLERIAQRTGCDLRSVAEVIELMLAARMDPAPPPA